VVWLLGLGRWLHKNEGGFVWLRRGELHFALPCSACRHRSHPQIKPASGTVSTGPQPLDTASNGSIASFIPHQVHGLPCFLSRNGPVCADHACVFTRAAC